MIYHRSVSLNHLSLIKMCGQVISSQVHGPIKSVKRKQSKNMEEQWNSGKIHKRLTSDHNLHILFLFLNERY